MSSFSFQRVGGALTTPQSNPSSQVACARGTTKPSSEATGCLRQRRKSLDSRQKALEGCVCVSLLCAATQTNRESFAKDISFFFFLAQKNKKSAKKRLGGGRCGSCVCVPMKGKGSPFAPLERDVDPNLRKLTFVRARYVSFRHSPHTVAGQLSLVVLWQKHKHDPAHPPTPPPPPPPPPNAFLTFFNRRPWENSPRKPSPASRAHVRNLFSRHPSL